MAFYVYIMASKPRGTLYTGSTSDLVRRIYEHRTKTVPGFTARYDVAMLVHFEVFDDYESERQRERRLKKWNRTWKLDLIEAANPQRRDLWADIARP